MRSLTQVSMTVNKLGFLFDETTTSWPHPIVLYKHLRSEHADLEARERRIRLGNVVAYRDTAALGVEIGDIREGEKTRETVIESAMTDEEGTLHGDTRIREFVSGTIGPRTYFGNVRIYGQRIVSPPTLCWCLSALGDRATALRMSPDYTATLKVGIDPSTLRNLRSVLIDLGLQPNRVALGIVDYVKDKRTSDKHNWHYRPSLTKETRYQYQREVRVLAEFPETMQVPAHLDVPSTWACMRRVFDMP